MNIDETAVTRRMTGEVGAGILKEGIFKMNKTLNLNLTPALQDASKNVQNHSDWFVADNRVSF